ncbi:MAG: hypothetical protein DRI69_06785 [Bacteroidetes bacterium]|nr:MAG: hypothetical protein DRI69_06785 [Bacteroidota bacterium]
MNLFPETDAYIAKANAFAVPILEHLRQLVHEECPDAKEVIKWGFPCFEYRGILCAMAAHKAHCSFSFWKGSIMSDPKGILEFREKTGMGHLGKIKSLEDLPDEEIFRKYLREAIELNKKGIKIPKKKVVRKELQVPDDMMAAIKYNKGALVTFEKFSYSHKNEYVEWITEAKTEKTRNKRLAQAIEWMTEGKGRNWKYVR